MRTAKAWIAFAGSLMTALTAALSDDYFNATDVQQVVLTGVTALFTLVATYQVPNKP
jgi:predicted amino acid-binding ACT domain protein